MQHSDCLDSEAVRTQKYRQFQRKHPPDDWEVDMTLCIGALATEIQTKRDRIIAITDTMQSLSDLTVSSEPDTAKVVPVGKSGKWIMMYAGNITTAIALCTAAEQRIGTVETPDAISRAFEQATDETLAKTIEHEVLAPFGLSRRGFLEDGRNMFGDEEFQRILYELRAVSLGVELILAGFDPNGVPHLISLADTLPRTGSRTTVHNNFGFYAIGNGATLANACLMGTYERWEDFTSTIYRLLEAKFRSEKAPGVGRKTVLLVIDSDGKWETMSWQNTEKLRQIWEPLAKPPVPPEAVTIIRECRYDPFKVKKPVAATTSSPTEPEPPASR